MAEAASAPLPAMPETSPRWPGPSSAEEPRPSSDLRSVQWRLNLGILPSSHSSSIDDIRRVTADSRRRYASLRRQHLVDPHILKDGRDSPNLLIDNPLSQNPDSTWSRFFRNAELEKMVDQDLTRLYPEHGSYFQTPGCQGTLRRILLLWCLKHPECGYRQGMHELLAPLLYVLQVDVEHLSQVRKLYEDQFMDKFDELSSFENDLYHFDVRRSTDTDATNVDSLGNAMKMKSLDEVDPDVKRLILLTDAYGAEGELGVVLSEKFMEHDAYSMFDALMSGGNGSVAMADFFSHSPVGGSLSGLPPVIEASAALYHLLSIVDSSLHSHLVELGVEPQYFALRWLRVLFGREFVLTDLLVVWDEIFMFGDTRLDDADQHDGTSTFRLLSSPRGAFVAALAVSMILHLRSSLLATEHATSCLQRLLNFPDNIPLNKVIDTAKSLQRLALDSRLISPAFPQSSTYTCTKRMAGRTRGQSSDSFSPTTPLNLVPDSYWEEKWRVLHKTEELKRDNSGKEARGKKGWSQSLRLSLSRTRSAPSPAMVETVQEINESARRNLMEDLAQPYGSNEDIEEINCERNSVEKDQNFVGIDTERENSSKDLISMAEDGYSSRNAGSYESSPLFSGSASPHSAATNHANDMDRSSIASNGSSNEEHHFPPVTYGDYPVKSDLNCDPVEKTEDSPPIANDDTPAKSGRSIDSTGKTVGMGLKERKLLSGKFQWLRKLGRNSSAEAVSERGGSSSDASKTSEFENNKYNSLGSVMGIGSSSPSVSIIGDLGNEQNVTATLKHLGHSMLEHIQVIESVFEPDRAQAGSLDNYSKSILVGKGQGTAMAALKELRKISNLLSEM